MHTFTFVPSDDRGVSLRVRQNQITNCRVAGDAGHLAVLPDLAVYGMMRDRLMLSDIRQS